MQENNSPNSSPTQGNLPKLTKKETKILELLNCGIIESKQIAAVDKTGMRNIQKIIRSIKKKGIIGISSPIVRQNERSGEQTNISSRHINENNGIRLHAQQFSIRPIWKSDKYQLSIGKKIEIDNNTILVHADSIQYYCKHSFFGSDTWASTAKSFEYHNKIFRILENDLGCVIVKDRSQNIEIVKAEYAHIQNGLAKMMENEGRKIRVRSFDGKVWFEIDNSWKLHEAETRGKTAQIDMQKVVEPFFNDMREKPNYLPSDTKDMIDKLAMVSSNLTNANFSYKPMFQEMNDNLMRFANAMEFYGKHFESHAGLIKEGTSMFKKINKAFKEKQSRLDNYLR